MKWIRTGRGAKALAVSMAMGLGMTACSRDYTVAYVYATSATKTTTGVVNAFNVDYQSGALQQLSDSPIPSGGSNPVALVPAPNGKNLYVINHDTSTVVQFAIGTDGKLYPQATTTVVTGSGLTGTFPTSIAIDPAGAFLYITFTYQNGYTAARPGPGGIAIFPLDSTGKVGTAVTNTTVGTTSANPLPYIPVGDNPVGVVASQQGNYLYVIDQEIPTTGSPYGVMLAYSRNTSTGMLTPITGTVAGGFAAGTSPAAIAEDPAGAYIYVTDHTTNQLYGYSVLNGGAPSPLLSSPYSTGLYPLGVTVDPRGTFVYVANFGSSTVSAYTIDRATGSLSSSGSAQTVATGPTCVSIEPALGIYLFTSNNTDNSISAEQLNPHSGALTPVQGTQFSAQPLPTCIVAVANGAHATQIVD